MIRLVGRPSEVGRRYGKILAPFIRDRVEAYRRRCEERGKSHPKRRAALEELLESEAPHWLEEYRAVAEAAGADLALLLELNCSDTLTAQTSCTSVWVSGIRAARGNPMLLKIRDERPQHQAMGYRRLDGTHAMLFGTDPCNLGVGQGCNRHGLAVANNSGGHVPESPEPVGFNDCQVTRLLLERARDVDEAIDVFADLVENGKIGLVDGIRGMIFLLADPTGKGRVIEATRDRFETLELDSGFVVWTNHWMLPGSVRFTRPVEADNPLYRSSVTRYERGLELLQDLPSISAADLEAFSRDEANPPFSICNGSDAFPWRTVSAFIYELDPKLELPVRVAPGIPGRVAYRSVPLWAEETPEAFLLDWEG